MTVSASLPHGRETLSAVFRLWNHLHPGSGFQSIFTLPLVLTDLLSAPSELNLQWIAGISGHISLNASLQNLTRKPSCMCRHCVDICHFMHIWYMYTLMCRNADGITQECSNLWSWTAQKFLGLKVCFLATWPASTSSQEYIYPSLLFHVYVATHKTTRNVGQTQTEMVQTIARTHTRQESQQAGPVIGSPKKIPLENLAHLWFSSVTRGKNNQ